MDRKIRETGSFSTSDKGIGHPRAVLTPETEGYILSRFQESLFTSNQAVGANIWVSYATMRRVLCEESIDLSPYREFPV